MTEQTADFSIRPATWQADEEGLAFVRRTVFMQEQGVPEELEWDGLDEHAFHLLAVDSENRPIGTVRLLPDGHIGRMAVLPAWRCKGIGTSLLTTALEAAAERGIRQVFLDAQTTALGFYARFGFQAEGDEFMDAGIPHRHMHKTL